MTRPVDPICALLRSERRRRGLSLAAVEAQSEGRWKAVVVSSYERGDRNPPLTNVRELLRWYGFDLEVVRLAEEGTP